MLGGKITILSLVNILPRKLFLPFPLLLPIPLLTLSGHHVQPTLLCWQIQKVVISPVFEGPELNFYHLPNGFSGP